MPEEQPSVIKRLDDRNKELGNFMSELNFEIARAYVENIKAVEGGITKLTPEQRVEIAGKVYDAEEAKYKEFLGLNSDKYWGQSEISDIFEKNSGVRKREFIPQLAQNMTLEGLVGCNNEVFQNLSSHEGKKAGRDLKDEELPLFAKELSTESEKRYNKKLNIEKIKETQEALAIYQALRSNSSPERFAALLKDYIVSA